MIDLIGLSHGQIGKLPGAEVETLMGQVAARNLANGVHNPLAQLRRPADKASCGAGVANDGPVLARMV